MRIVLVDPSRAVQRVMTRLIEEGGHDVIAFADGLKAIDCIAQDDDVRALITSTQPLNISGVDLCTAARKLSGTRRALHVVLMSSTDDYYLAVKALDNGADDFIHKPPNPDELRARLRLADRVTLMKQQLIQYATMDSLTGLLNRRAFFESAAEMCHAAQAGSHSRASRSCLHSIRWQNRGGRSQWLLPGSRGVICVSSARIALVSTRRLRTGYSRSGMNP